MLDALETDEIEETFNYFDVQNLSFDHPLTSSEIEEFKSIIFSLNNLHQIYFKGSIDIASIETIKNLLAISGYIDDEKVEKYIVKMFPFCDIERLLGANYEHPSTWQIAYRDEDSRYELVDIPNYRELYTFLSGLKSTVEEEELTSLEKILRVYDIVKLLEYDGQIIENEPLSDIITSRRANPLGFHQLFCYLLKTLGIKATIGREKSENGKETFITLVDIHDEKYDIDGMYLFDPWMDSLPKDTYKSEEIRRMNYNYFGLQLSDIALSRYQDTLIGALGILAIENFDDVMERKDKINDQKTKKEWEALEEEFGEIEHPFHERVKNSRPINWKDISSVVHHVYKENTKVENYDELLRENYESRKEELFYPKTEELLARMLK